MGRYSVHLVGEANYQAAIKNLSPGDPVTLIPEPKNPYDPRAIRCADITGTTLGYVERDSWLTRAMLDDETAISATVEAVIGGEKGKPSLGVVLSVRTAADAMAPPNPEPAAAQPVLAANTAAEKPKKSKGCLKVLAWSFGALVILGMIVDGLAPDPKKPEPAATASPTPPPTPDAAEIKANADRKAGFHCLSKWDGSHRELVNELKQSLRDPDSFEQIETRMTPVNDKGYHGLIMQYRARNGFGGMNVGRLIATVKNSDCSFEIVSNANS